MPNTMEIKASSQSQDPWDAALFGGAAQSMYKSAAPAAPASSPATPAPEIKKAEFEVTSVFKQAAGIPRDITPEPVVQPVIIKTTPVEPPKTVLSPLSATDILADVPHPSKKVVSQAIPGTKQPLQPLLAPAYPVRSLALNALFLLIGIPIFAAGFFLADYTKNYNAQQNVANAAAAIQVAATSTPAQ